MKFQVHRIFFAFISIVLLTAGGFVPDLFAQCFLTEGLSEEQQTDLARQMFEDGLYQEAWNTSSCYLQEFRSGKSRENMMFLQARASQQAGSLNQALRDLQKFQKTFPGSRKYQEEVLFRKGVVLARMQQYSGALQTLKLLLREYPASKFKDESLYWQGFVTFYRAELIRQETTLKEAVPEFRQVSRQLETLDPEILPEQQAEERLNLLGNAANVIGMPISSFLEKKIRKRHSISNITWPSDFKKSRIIRRPQNISEGWWKNTQNQNWPRGLHFGGQRHILQR